MKYLDFEVNQLLKKIKVHNAKRVLLQLPEGLKPEALQLASNLQKNNILVVISADPCYGACDIAVEELKQLDLDLVIHTGHSKFYKCGDVPSIYLPVKATVPITPVLKQALVFLKKYDVVGLATTVQHVHTLSTAQDLLINAGKKVLVGDAKKLTYPGQVLGCDLSNVVSIASSVDAFLFVGSGKFHSLGIALATSKPTFVADPYLDRVYSIMDEVTKILKQRWANIQEASHGKIFGILLSLKPGQKRFNDAIKIKNELEAMGKTVYLLSIKEITPDFVLQFPAIDAYINTACPRISIDDAPKFRKPLLTITEYFVMAGRFSWEKILRNGLFEN